MRTIVNIFLFFIVIYILIGFRQTVKNTSGYSTDTFSYENIKKFTISTLTWPHLSIVDNALKYVPTSEDQIHDK